MPGFILLTMMGCRAFVGCAGDLPSPPDQTEPIDTAPEVVDTADTGPVDTGPPPLCEWPEEEPNSTLGQAQELPMETWGCGTLETAGDFDIFRFSLESAGWVKVWVRGQDLGTSSNLQLTLDDASYDYTTLVTSSPGSLDPILVFPVEEPNTFYATIADQFYGYGEDYIWQIIASEAKAPVLWTGSEVEPNDGIQDGLLIETGDRMFGLIDAGSDADWFLVTLPEGVESVVTARIEAWNYGSPINARISLYDGSESRVATSAIGVNSYDLDPILTYEADADATAEGTVWGIKVEPREGSGGGLAYWYVLEVMVEMTDTGL
ncbi:MAG: hypothetical protein P8R54_05115 [Myxococcota bacterium]|nr:hypothetical protein [Myxococcota bacterium]